MNNNLYAVLYNNETLIADKLMLNNALLFVEAYFEKYYLDTGMRLTIKRVRQDEKNDNKT